MHAAVLRRGLNIYPFSYEKYYFNILLLLLNNNILYLYWYQMSASPSIVYKWREGGELSTAIFTPACEYVKVLRSRR